MKTKYGIKRFRSIVKNQDIELDSSKINIILGTNGSGKSNFLDAIRWFSGEDIKNIKSRKTVFHPEFDPTNLYLDSPEIVYSDELDKDETDYIFDLLKEINIFFNKKIIFQRYFIQYKDLYYKDLDACKNGLTDLGKIKEKIVLKFKDYWPMGLFVQEESEFKFKYWKLVITPDAAKREISYNKNNLSLEIKNLLYKSIDVWVDIEDLFKIKPIILFSRNLEADNNILFEYPIYGVKNPDSLNPTFKNILNMLGKNTINDIQQIINLSTSDSNRPIIRDLKDKLTTESKKFFEKIFNNFTINTIPEIVLDDNMFQIVIKANNYRYYGTSETAYQSSGFKAFLWLIIMLEVIKFWDTTKFGKIILIVDEPDKSLHILLQYELAKYLKTNFTNQNNAFILLTSHSPFLIPNLDENIYIAEMDKKGCTMISKASSINDVRSAGIFPLIALFHMEKLKKDLFLNLNEKVVRIYYKDSNKNNNKIENYVKNILQERFRYQLVPVNDEESKHLIDLKTSNFFSKHIYKKENLSELINHNTNEKDVYLTDKFIKSILSNDILDSLKK